MYLSIKQLSQWLLDQWHVAHNVTSLLQ